jgi:hypothetical protein
MIDFFGAHVNLISASANATSSIALYTLGSILLYYIFKLKISDETDLRQLLIGLAMMCFGLGTDAAYWAYYRYAEAFGGTELSNWMQMHNEIGIIAVIFGTIGTTIMISPILARVFDIQTRMIKWYNIVIAFAFIVFLFFAFYTHFSVLGLEKQLKEKKQIIIELNVPYTRDSIFQENLD